MFLYSFIVLPTRNILTNIIHVTLWNNILFSAITLMRLKLRTINPKSKTLTSVVQYFSESGSYSCDTYSPFHSSLPFEHLHHTKRSCVPKI